MIERHWKSICKTEQAGNYHNYLIDDTFKKLRLIEGFENASILTCDLNDGVEFLVITRWESLTSIQQFAGGDINVAVVPKPVQEMMISYDHQAKHYQVLGN